MKKFNKNLIGIVLAIALVLGFNPPIPAHATLATGFLGVATGYSVFGDAGISEAGTNTPNTLWGDIGINGVVLSPSASGEQVGTFHDTDPGSDVVNATGAAHLALIAEVPTGTVDLDTANIAVGPGIYTVTTTAFSKTLTLTGPGTYVFQRTGGIAQTDGGTMILDGACASDVYWYTSTDMTFAAGGNFFGTISAGTAITFAAAATLQGRAWAGTYVALNSETITEPVACAAAVIASCSVSPTSTTTGTSVTWTAGTPTGGTGTGYTYTWGGTDSLSGSDTTVSKSYSTVGTKTATITVADSANNSSGLVTCTNSVLVSSAPSRSSSGSSVTYGCKDPTATNYNAFSASKPELCLYEPTITILSTPVVVHIIPKLPKTGFPTASTLGQQVKTIESSLRKGSNGGNVITLQQFLISENKGGKAIALKDSGADGKFGPITESALAEWQTTNVLIGDGIFGQKTRAYLSAHY